MKNIIITTILGLIIGFSLADAAFADEPVKTSNLKDGEDFFIVAQFPRLDFADKTWSQAKVVACGETQADALKNAETRLNLTFAATVKNDKGEMISFNAEKQLITLLKDGTWFTTSFSDAFNYEGISQDDLKKADSCKSFSKSAFN